MYNNGLIVIREKIDIETDKDGRKEAKVAGAISRSNQQEQSAVGAPLAVVHAGLKGRCQHLALRATNC